MATGSVSKYFSGTKGKRKSPSTSSASDSAVSPASDNSKPRHTQKKHKQNVDSDKMIEEDMDLREAIRDIQETLLNMVTKTDIEDLKSEMSKLTNVLSDRIEQLESLVFDIQSEKDKLSSEVEKLKGGNMELKVELDQKNKELARLRRDINDNEQHGRQWNVRVYGVRESQGETVDECIKKCVTVFNKQVGVTSISTADVEIAHRAGKQGPEGSRPRPVLLRFLSRRQRGQVLAERRRLKGTGVSIGEDLTHANYQLLRKVTNHSATMSAWTSNGKVLSKLKNGKIVRVDIDTDVDTVFRREMGY